MPSGNQVSGRTVARAAPRFVRAATAGLLVLALAGCGGTIVTTGPLPNPTPPSAPALPPVLWHVHAHGGPVLGLTVDPADALLAVADDDAPLYLFDAATGAKASTTALNVFPGSDAVAFRPDGKQLAVGTYNGVLVFDVATMQQVAKLAHPTDAAVDALAWSPDGTYLAAGHRPGRGGQGDLGLSVFDVASGSEVYDYKTTGWVTSLAWSRDGTLLAAGVMAVFGGPSLEIFDASAMTHQRSIATTVAANGLTWHDPSGTFWSTDGSTIHRWDPATGTDDPVAAQGAVALAARPGTADVAVGYDDGSVAVVDAAAASPKVVAQQDKGVTDVTWSADGSTLYSADGSGTVVRTSLGSGAHASFLLGRGRSYGVAWSPDDTRIATGGGDGAVRIWNAVDGTLAMQSYAFPTPYGVQAMAWRPDGTSIGVMGAGEVQILDASTLSEQTHFPYASYYSDADMAWSHDGTKLALGGSASAAVVWDAATAKGTALPAAGNAVAWSPDDRRVVVGGGWDFGSSAFPTAILRLSDLQEVDLATAPTVVQAVAWGPPGVAVGVDGAIDLFDPDTGALDTSVALGTSNWPRVFATRWSSDGKRLAIASDYSNLLQASVSVYDAATGDVSPVLGMGGPISGPGALAWSHDGTRLAVVDWEGNLAVVDMAP